MKKLADIRKDYQLQILDESEILPDPMKQFEKWWHDVLLSEIDELNAMTLATANKQGRPSARVVLLKEYNPDGFIFYTNYESHKGTEMQENNQVSLLFFWKELERQVRIDGIAEKISAEENDLYFNSRPEGSKIGAWASPQSQVIESRDFLEKKVMEHEQKFTGKQIVRPAHWGGYIVKPNSVEFWQGRPNRLHDRIQYSKQKSGDWKTERLAP